MKGKQGDPLRFKWNRMKQHYQRYHKKWVLTVYLVIRILVALVAIHSIKSGRWENVLVCVLTFFPLFLPSLFQWKLRIELPSILEVIIIFFIFAAEVLGESQAFYERFVWWDTMLHTINGIISAAVGFTLLDMVNGREGSGTKMSPLFLAFAAFCFAMTISVLWEFFEFTADCFLHTDMQKDTVLHLETHSNKLYSNMVVVLVDSDNL